MSVMDGLFYSVRVCVCVCVWRERERETDRQIIREVVLCGWREKKGVRKRRRRRRAKQQKRVFWFAVSM